MEKGRNTQKGGIKHEQKEIRLEKRGETYKNLANSIEQNKGKQERLRRKTETSREWAEWLEVLNVEQHKARKIETVETSQQQAELHILELLSKTKQERLRQRHCLQRAERLEALRKTKQD